MVWLSDFTYNDEHYNRMIGLEEIIVTENHDKDGTQTRLCFLFDDGTEYEIVVNGEITSEGVTKEGSRYNA